MGKFVGTFGNLKRIQVYLKEEDWQEFEDFCYQYYRATIHKDTASYSKIAGKMIMASIRLAVKGKQWTWIDDE